MKLAIKVILGAVMFAALFGGGWWIWRAEERAMFEVLIRSEKRAMPDAERYEVLRGELGRWRESLAEAYAQAGSEEERRAVEYDARVVLELVLPEMMRCWLGTGYDFNGIAEKPGSGKIACGYYVSTVMRDAGFKVNRYKLAQQPSENIMRTFLGRDACLLKVGEEYDRYVDWIEGLERGIYLVGLDTHVGFIVNQMDGIHFFHSSGVQGVGVVEEGRAEAVALRNSRWRMLGNLSGDAGVMRTWLGGKTVRVIE